MAKVNLFELGKKLSSQKEDQFNINTIFIFEPDSNREYITNDYFDSNDTENSKKLNLGIKYNIYSKQNNRQNAENLVNSCQVYKMRKNDLTIDLFRTCLSNIKSGQTITMIIVIDLSKLDCLIECLIDFSDQLKKILNEFIQKNQLKNSNYIEMISTFKKSNTNQNIDEFPIPLMIVGCNLIKFLEINEQDRQLVQKILRHFCLVNFAQLYFLNEQSEYSIHRCKLLVNHLSFEFNSKETLKLNQMDKSLLILFGQDKLENIYGDKILNLNDSLQLFKNKFEQKKIDTKSIEKAKIDLFVEPDIELIYKFNLEKLEFRQFHDK